MSSNQQNRSQNNNNSGQPRRRNNTKKNYNSKSNSNRRGVPPRRKMPAPQLTRWQKFLKAIGLYKDPSNENKKPAAKKATPDTRTSKTNTRSAKAAPAQGAPKPPPPQKVDSSRLYVGNLSYEVTETDLVDLFKGFGNVRNTEIVYNKRTQRSKGFAFVDMMNVDDAKRASEVLHEQPFMGRNMIVNGARTKEEQNAALTSPEA